MYPTTIHLNISEVREEGAREVGCRQGGAGEAHPKVRLIALFPSVRVHVFEVQISFRLSVENVS